MGAACCRADTVGGGPPTTTTTTTTSTTATTNNSAGSPPRPTTNTAAVSRYGLSANGDDDDDAATPINTPTATGSEQQWAGSVGSSSTTNNYVFGDDDIHRITRMRSGSSESVSSLSGVTGGGGGGVNGSSGLPGSGSTRGNRASILSRQSYNSSIKRRRTPANSSAASDETAGLMPTHVEVELTGGVLPSASAKIQPQNRGWDNADTISVETIMENFFEQCHVFGVAAVRANILTLDDFEDREPFLFLGLPSLVAFECARRSIAADSLGLVLADGTEVTAATQPKAEVGQALFASIMALKSRLRDASLTKPEVRYVQQIVLAAGETDRAVEPLPPTAAASDKRRALLMRLSGSAQSVGTDISRAPFFLDNFPLVLDAVVEDAGAADHPDGYNAM